MNSSGQHGPAELRAGRWLLILSLLSGVGLMVVDRPAAPLVLDEHVSYWIASSDSPGSIVRRSLDYAATPPLSSVLQRMALSMGGRRPAVLRCVSWLAFLAAIAVTYAAGSKACGPVAGGVAALFLAWHPEALDVMRLARPYALSVCLAACAVYAALYWLDAPDRWPRAFLFAVAGSALVWTHYLNAPLLVLLFGLLVFRVHWRKAARGDAGPGPAAQPALSIQQLLAAGALVMLACLPFWQTLWRLVDWTHYMNRGNAPSPWLELLGPHWWAGLPAGLLVAGVLKRFWSSAPAADARPKDASLVPWILLGLLPVVALAILCRTSHPGLGELRYRVVYAPATALLFAVLLVRIARPAAAVPGVVAALAVAWSLTGPVPWRSDALTSPAEGDWKLLAETLNERGEPDEPVFVHSGLIESWLTLAFFRDPLFMDYVSCRLGRFYVVEPHPRSALPWYWSEEEKLLHYYREILLNAKQGGQTVWVAAETDTDIGRISLEGFSRLAAGLQFEIVERHTKGTAALIGFRSTEIGSTFRVDE